MPDYSKGKVYKLWSPLGDLIYIGSTTQSLSKRLGGHRGSFKMNKGTTSKYLFEEYGIDQVKIELIENCPCNSKMELMRREGYFIKTLNCVNKTIPGRDKDEKLVVRRLIKYKSYHNNPEWKRKQQTATKNWHDNNKQRVLDNFKRWACLKYECHCGAVITQGHKAEHEKTKKHKKWDEWRKVYEFIYY